jgi:NAD(P)-dependent dehydrogenase (short-subunit alcohol dehydrogenase family)
MKMKSEHVEHLFDLSGRVAVVTGGGGGLGSAIAIGLAGAGASVVVLDINQELADNVVQEIRSNGGEARAMSCNVTVKSDFEEVNRTLDTIDILVNSAGTTSRHAAEDFPEDIYDRIIATNLKGTFMSCQIFGRRMLDRNSGSIINMASIGSSIAYPHTTAYLQSKGGVAQMTRSLALEWISRGVRVNAIAPSLFDTPLVRASENKVQLTSDFIMARTPIGRKGDPLEVVGPAIFLASDAASMVTGHLLQVDGGYLIN